MQVPDNMPRLLRDLHLPRELLLILILLSAKVALVTLSFTTGPGALGMILASGAFLLLLGSLVLLLRPNQRLPLLIGFNLLVTVVLIADSLFYRYYERVIPLPVLHEAGQVGGVMSSLLALLSVRDALLFADFMFLIPYLLLQRKQRNRRTYGMPKTAPSRPLRRRITHTAMIGSLAASLLSYQFASVLYADGADAFQDLYSNDAVLRKLGILNYHAADLYKTFGGGPNVASASDMEVLKTWMKVRRSEETPRLQAEAKGLNLIMIQVEAFQAYLLNTKIGGQEITPNLNRLMKESLYFDDYFPQIGDGNTSDAEFMTLNSLYPLPAGVVYMKKNQNSYQSLPKLMKDKGYQTAAFHNYVPDFFTRDVMYRHEGFDNFYNASTFQIDEQIGMGLTDASMYRQAVPIMKEMKEPFFSFFISLTGHYPYTLPDNLRELPIPEGQYSKIFNKYLHVQHYADKALGKFLDDLKKEGLLDKSLLVVYGDHFAKGPEEPEIYKLKGVTQAVTDQMRLEIRKVPLMMRFPAGKHAGVEHITGGQMDLLPTLANLLDLDKSKMFYFGQDLFNNKNGHAVFRNHTEKGTFFTKDLFYHGSTDGQFAHGTCYNRATGEKVSLSRCEPIYKQASWQWQMSDMILENNNLQYLLKSSNQ